MNSYLGVDSSKSYESQEGKTKLRNFYRQTWATPKPPSITFHCVSGKCKEFLYQT